MLALGGGTLARQSSLSRALQGREVRELHARGLAVSLARAPQGEPGNFASRGEKYDYDDEVERPRDSTNYSQ